MKKVFLFIVFLFAAANSFAQSTVYVQGYTRSNITYVQGHYRTAPDATITNNWSTVGNVNPYTGKPGTVSYSSSTSSYSSYSSPNRTHFCFRLYSDRSFHRYSSLPNKSSKSTF